MLSIKDIYLKKGTPSKQILCGISAFFPEGEISLLTGKSGAGKSSLLRCMAQLETAYEGQVFFKMQLIQDLASYERAKTLGYIAQGYTLFPHLTVLENCSQPLMVVAKMQSSLARQKAVSVLESLGMEEYFSAYPCELSGGQQQRVAIARVLAFNPQIVLLDEPSSALDPDNSALLATILKKMAFQGKILVVSTQDTLFAQQLEATSYCMEDGRLCTNKRN